MVKLARVFKYNSIQLDDPDPKMSAEDVKQFYANIYPELTQATIDGPNIEEEGESYEFRKLAGTKGLTIQDLIAEAGYEDMLDGKAMNKLAGVFFASEYDEKTTVAPPEAQAIV